MSDRLEVDRIMSMSMPELLRYILDHPELICDSYYRTFGDAIRNRAEELLA